MLEWARREDSAALYTKSPSAGQFVSVRDLQCAQFLLSAASLTQLPPDTGVEIAFAGRSNAGKSSALNAITGVKNLARTSKTPGRTQLLNFFTLDDNRRLVDLPGYGFAKVPDAVKQAWERTVTGYLERRRSLVGLFLIMDSRHVLTQLDTVMISWCHAADLSLHILLTKVDKLNRGDARSTLTKVTAEVGNERTSVQLFSALSGEGREAAQKVLLGWFRNKKGPGNKGKESGADNSRQ